MRLRRVNITAVLKTEVKANPLWSRKRFRADTGENQTLTVTREHEVPTAQWNTSMPHDDKPSFFCPNSSFFETLFVLAADFFPRKRRSVLW